MYHTALSHQFQHDGQDSYYSPAQSESSYSNGFNQNDDMRMNQDMIVSHEEEMIWEPEHPSSNPVHYLAVDTNVFISHLNLIRTIHNLLLATKPSPIILLIPSVVIHELDGLKNSRAPSEPGSPITLGRLVQSANGWLLEIHRNRRLTGNGALRCQSLKERWDTNIRDHGQNDDEILDCCLHFSNLGSKVTLWTDDKNLSVKAESNDIPTLGGTAITPTDLFNSLNEELPESLWQEIRRLANHDTKSFHNENQNGNDHGIKEFDHDMDMDHDLLDPPNNHINGDMHEPPQITSILYQPQAEKRYPYLLPSTNPEHASTPVPTSTTSTAPSTTPWQRTSTATTPIPTNSPFQQSAINPQQSIPTPASPISIPMDRDENSSNSRIQLTPSVVSPRTPPLSRHPSPFKTKIPITPSQSPTKSGLDILTPSRPTSTTPSKYPPTSTSTISTGPSVILLTSIQLSLRPSLITLLQHCPNHPISPGHSIETDQILSTLLSTLTILDDTLKQQGEEPSSDVRISLIQSMSATRTMINYIDYYSNWNKGGLRKIRSGELIASLLILIKLFKTLGLGSEGESDILYVITEIERLD